MAIILHISYVLALFAHYLPTLVFTTMSSEWANIGNVLPLSPLFAHIIAMFYHIWLMY